MAIDLAKTIGAGLILKQQLITATGTWTRPEKMVGDTVWLTMIGGGGAGGKGAGGTGWGKGGSGGAYIIDAQVTLGVESSVACTIGQGGTVTPSVAAGTTSFGAYASCPGQVGAAGGHGNDNTGISYSGNSTPLGSGGSTGYSGYGGGGGGGLVLGTAPPLPVNSNSGYGYGAGGAGSTGSGAGAVWGVPGAILVKWAEFI